MAIQYSTGHRTAAMTTLNGDIGVNAILKVFTGSPPANCGTTDSGTLLVTFAGNAAQFGTVSGGVLTASAVANATASGAGTAGYFRIYPSGGGATAAVVQGTVTATGGGGDMTLTNAVIAVNQVCTFASLTVTAFGV